MNNPSRKFFIESSFWEGQFRGLPGKQIFMEQPLGDHRPPHQKKKIAEEGKDWSEWCYSTLVWRRMQKKGQRINYEGLITTIATSPLINFPASSLNQCIIVRYSMMSPALDIFTKMYTKNHQLMSHGHDKKVLKTLIPASAWEHRCQRMALESRSGCKRRPRDRSRTRSSG